MTIAEVLEQVEEVYPNEVSQKLQIQWLANLDRQITAEIVDNHEVDSDYEEPDFSDYDYDTELIVPDMYSDVYIAYLRMKIAEALVESDRYAFAQGIYNDYYITFVQWYNRTHMPLQKGTQRYRS